MLTPRSQVIISHIFQQGSFFHVIPFTWNSKNKELHPVHRWALIPSITILSITWLNVIYMTTALYRAPPGSLSPTSKSIHGFLLICGIVAAVFGYNNILRRREVANFMNKFARFQKEMEDQYLVDASKCRTNICELMLQSFLILIYVQSLGGTFLFLRNPMAPRYFYSRFAHLVDPKFKYLYFVCEYLLYICYWFMVIIDIVLMLSYWYGTTFWLAEMRSSKEDNSTANTVNVMKPTNALTHAQLKWPSISLNVFQSAIVLNKCFHIAFSDIVLTWSQFLIILLPASGNYAIIRTHGHLSLISLASILLISLSCLAVCIFGYPVAAAINTLSTAYLRAFKLPHVAPKLTTVQKKRARASRPLKIQVGRILFIRPITVLKLINSIIYWTMRSLLIFR